MSTPPALGEGTASIELAGRTVAGAKPKALEPGAYGEAGNTVTRRSQTWIRETAMRRQAHAGATA